MATLTGGHEKWIENLQSVLSDLDSMAISERQRATIRRACSESLVDAEDRIEFDYEHRNSSSKWSSEEVRIVQATLEPLGPCLGWKEEQNILFQVARKVGRPAKVVKKKCIELGYASKVDYWMNKHLPGAEQ